MFEIFESTQTHSTIPNVQKRFAVITGDSLYLLKQFINLCNLKLNFWLLMIIEILFVAITKICKHLYICYILLVTKFTICTMLLSLGFCYLNRRSRYLR